MLFLGILRVFFIGGYRERCQQDGEPHRRDATVVAFVMLWIEESNDYKDECKVDGMRRAEEQLLMFTWAPTSPQRTKVVCSFNRKKRLSNRNSPTKRVKN